MKRLLSASLAAIGIATAGPSLAADMRVKALPPAPVGSWAGFYIGGNLGVVSNRSRFTDIDDYFLGTNDTFLDRSETGFTLGGQVGYNWQVSTIVFGVEGDLNWVNSKANVAIGPRAIVASATMDWMS